MDKAVLSGWASVCCARGIKFSPAVGLIPATADEYREMIVARVREAELRTLREESNRIHSPLCVFTLKRLICIAAIPALLIGGFVTLIFALVQE